VTKIEFPFCFKIRNSKFLLRCPWEVGGGGQHPPPPPLKGGGGELWGGGGGGKEEGKGLFFSSRREGNRTYEVPYTH